MMYYVYAIAVQADEPTEEVVVLSWSSSDDDGVDLFCTLFATLSR